MWFVFFVSPFLTWTQKFCLVNPPFIVYASAYRWSIKSVCESRPIRSLNFALTTSNELYLELFTFLFIIYIFIFFRFVLRFPLSPCFEVIFGSFGFYHFHTDASFFSYNLTQGSEEKIKITKRYDRETKGNFVFFEKWMRWWSKGRAMEIVHQRVLHMHPFIENDSSTNVQTLREKKFKKLSWKRVWYGVEKHFSFSTFIPTHIHTVTRFRTCNLDACHSDMYTKMKCAKGLKY